MPVTSEPEHRPILSNIEIVSYKEIVMDYDQIHVDVVCPSLLMNMSSVDIS